MPPAEPSDVDVFRDLHAGQLSALNILYHRYSTPVYRLALRLLGSPEDAADLTHEVFLLLWRKPSYDPARGSMLVFLMMMTRSQALNRIRTTKSQQRLLEQCKQAIIPLDDTPGLLEDLSLHELASHVRQALAKLPSYQREVLELAYYQGLSHAEITERLAVPLGTVKSRSRQGLLKLRQLLKHVMN
ncbi:MAG: sigma-70 family RNA polymerase sigma factor [Synechococcales cyanobacterium CRU_2_2]|nr:sigma-70 family RNA polymerase sigma factor [Synechococcales cyanobacterium CRU_2_2]